MEINLELIKSKIQPSDWDIACQNWGLIEDALYTASITDVYNLAGVCATVAVETGCTFRPVDERGDAAYFIRNYWSNKYTCKMLGNKSPADAVNYHGRGYIQITGRYNYTCITNDLGANFIGNPGLACEPDMAAKVLVWFWKFRKLDKLCENITEQTMPAQKLMIYQQVRRLVNGALLGLPLYMDVLKDLGVI